MTPDRPARPTDDNPNRLLAPARRPDELGRLGTYRILGVLGRGGMGVVYQAEDSTLKRKAALKVMLPSYAADPVARRRFLREATAQAAVEHDHIVAIYQVGEAGGVPFIAMPLLKGLSLGDALKADPRPPLAQVVRIGREIAEGLAAAHEAGLVHRDIKPGNVWLEGPRRRVKILDFGLARMETTAPDSAGPLTTAGTIVGTPAYMSPEQANGDRVDARSDLFSLGVVLYQMAAGEQPFRGPNMVAVLNALTKSDPVPLRTHRPDVPPRLDRLVDRLLAKDPAARPAAADTAAELRAIQADLDRSADTVAGSPDHNPWATLDLTEPAETVPARRSPHPPVARPSATRRPWGILAAAVLVILGSAVGLYLAAGPLSRGELRIEFDHPETEARFAGEVRLFDQDDRLQDTVKAGERVRSLPPGTYRADLAGADGLRLESPDFILEPRGTAMLRIARARRMVALTPVAKKDPAAGDPHRRAAEAILRNGGEISVRTALQDLSVAQLAGLPREPFVVRGIRLVNRPVPDEVLAALSGIDDLGVFTLYRANLTDAGLRPLAGLRTRTAHLNDNRFSDQGVNILADGADLAVLQMSGTPIADTAVFHLLRLTNLRTLNVADTLLTDAGLRVLSRHPTLRTLLVGPGIPPDGWAVLKDLRHLQDLQARGATDEAIPALGELKQLRVLRQPSLTDEGARTLQQALPDTVILHTAARPTDAERRAIRWALDQKAHVQVILFGSVETIKDVPDGAFVVNNLTLPAGGPTGGAENLRGIRGINTLVWDGLKDADAAAGHLATLDSLTYLSVSGSDLTAVGLERLSRLTQLETLYYRQAGTITDAALAELPRFPHLASLTLGNAPITDAGLAPLGRVSRLNFLELVQCPNLTGAGLHHLAALPVLRYLKLTGTPVDDSALPALKQLTQVRMLDVTGTLLTDAAIQELRTALPRCAILWTNLLVVPGSPPAATDPDRKP